MALIKKEFEKANLTHARELEAANQKHVDELEEANRTHARELAEVREGWTKAKEAHEREMKEVLSTIHQLQAQSRVSH